MYILSDEKNNNDRFAGRGLKFSRLPGWEANSWGYYGDDGHALSADKSGAQYGPPFGSKLRHSRLSTSFLSGCSWRYHGLWN